ncbi:MAG: hypothetical protein ACYTE3_24135, partial [Planctomycetota bacterium]
TCLLVLNCIYCFASNAQACGLPPTPGIRNSHWQHVPAGGSLQFDGSWSYDNDENYCCIEKWNWKSYYWNWNTGSYVWYSDFEGRETTQTFDPGKYNIQLRVVDDEGTPSPYYEPDYCYAYVVAATGVSSPSNTLLVGDPMTFSVVTFPSNCGHYVNITWTGTDNKSGSGTLFENVSWSSAGTKTVTAHCGTTNPSKDIHVWELDELQYKIGNDAYQAAPVPPASLAVAKGADVTFKAVKTYEPADWPTGKPVWSGSSGASGTGGEKEVSFDVASSTPTDYKVVEVECSNTLRVNVVVVDLSALEINAQRIAGGPTESPYPVEDGDHMGIGANFQFDLMLNTGTVTWPTPEKLDAELWDLDWGNEVLGSFSGPSFSVWFTTGCAGRCKVRFYFDNNTNGNSTTGVDDPHVDSEDFEVQAVNTHALTFAKSSVITGSIDAALASACSQSTADILRKDTSDDYRAIAELLVDSVTTYAASTHDPIYIKRTGSYPNYEYDDSWGDWAHWKNSNKDVSVIDGMIIICDANKNTLDTWAGCYWEGHIAVNDSSLDCLVHELGHKCGLDDTNNNIDHVMYESTAGNESLLTQSEADNFE